MDRAANSNFVLMIFSALLIYLVIPAFMIGGAPGDYSYLALPVLMGFVVVSIVATAIASAAIALVIRLTGSGLLLRPMIVFVWQWILLAGLLFPVSASAGMKDAVEFPVNALNLTVVTLLSLALSWAYGTKLSKFIFLFSVVLASLSLFNGTRSFLSSVSLRADEGFTSLSSEKNILVFSFDGVPGQAVETLMREDLFLSEAFRDFRIYDGVVSSFPATMISLAGDVYGNVNFSAMGSTQSEIDRALDKEKALINRPEFDTYTYSNYNFFNLDRNTKIDRGDLINKVSPERLVADVEGFFSFEVARVGTRFLAKVLDRAGFPLFRFQALVLDPFLRGQETDFKLEAKLADHPGPQWEITYILSLRDFDDMVSGFTGGNPLPCLRYMHFTFTHFPVDFDENGTYRSSDKKWYYSNQNEKGIANETSFAVNRMVRVIERLRALGIYDNSLIVLKSDHGKPANYYSSPPLSYHLNGHPMWGYDRYRPFLMIKGFDSDRDAPEHISELVTLGDLSRTLWLNSGLSFDHLDFPGVDLLGPEIPVEGKYFFYAPPTDPHVDWRFDHFLTTTFRRDEELLDSIERSPLVELTTP